MSDGSSTGAMPPDERVIRPRDLEHNEIYGRNKIQTTKYTLITFLPKNLFEQFHRLANWYFLMIVVLNWVPQINAFAPAIAMLPLVFVLAVTAIKDLYEDRRRRKSDIEINSRESRVMDSNNSFTKRMWKYMHVGDLVELREGDVIPADLLLLHADGEEGICYVETANLDGETNLKQRMSYAPHDPRFDPISFKGVVNCEPPNNKIYEFKGKLTDEGQVHSLDARHMLLRGCIVRNTPRVIGLVVYCGHDTKAMLNNTGPRSKRSKLEKLMNTEIIYCCLILLGMCITGAFGTAIWLSRRDYKDILYIPFASGDPGPALEGFIRFWTFFIVLQVMVPISLYVSIEIVKLGQVYFIQEDIDLYYEEQDKKMHVRALNITEDLGQIEYVFCDKTGTLTQNKMIFHQCSINGTCYEHGDKEEGKDYQDQFSFPRDRRLVAATEKLKESPNADSPEHLFLLSLAICNTVVPNIPEEDEHRVMELQPGDIRYEAESPDEAALVAAAQLYDYTLISSKSQQVVVNELGQRVTYKVLFYLPFDSVRKRMSVIVRRPDGKVLLLTKGADVNVYDVLARSETGQDTVAETTQVHLDVFARNGLRTLSYGYRFLDEAAFDEWANDHRDALTAIEGRKERVFESMARIEHDLVLLGASGIEDKLQDGVPETIASLREAGLHVWVLTGDKQETAIEIAHTCQLLTREMDLALVNSQVAVSPYDRHSTEATEQHHQEAIEEVEDVLKERIQAAERSDKATAVVVDGATLAYVLKSRTKLGAKKPSASADSDDDTHLIKLFLKLIQLARVVVCCRMAPLQKAQVVRLVKRHSKVMTLSIGDGANDVSMIQMADIGVGISGQEGMQAVMASDYAIAQFRFLKRLLLVHGHWNYDRLAKMILYFFFKNALFVYVIWWFQFYCGFSAMNAIEQLYLNSYNLAWTSLPPIAMAVFDQDCSDKFLLAHPRLYDQGRLNLTYAGYFWWNMLDAVWQSLVIFFIPYFIYVDGGTDNNGILMFGTLLMFETTIAANIDLALITRSFTWMNWLFFGISIFGLFAFGLAYNAIPSVGFVPDPYWVMEVAVTDASFWFAMILGSIAAPLPRFLWLFCKDWFKPTPAAYARECEVLAEKAAQGPGCCSRVLDPFCPVGTRGRSGSRTLPLSRLEHRSTQSVL
eukprot:m.13053 g.13053  ORF g.13053 m.13053 type:complete len:1156 (+) comp4442_c0_seq1:490-3957(+)